MNKKSAFAKAVEISYFIFLIAIAALALVNLSSRTPQKSPMKILSVVSGSMSPTIPVGSAVLVQQAENYYVNDVITYKLNNKLVTHRVMYAGDTYMTKGDANDAIDKQPVEKSQVMGKVTFYLPYVGYLQESTKSWWGLIVFVYVPGVVIFIIESISIVREFRRMGMKKPSMRSLGPLLMSFCVLSGVTYAFYSTKILAFSGDISATLAASPSPSGSVSPTPSASASPSMSPTPTGSASATPSASPTISPTVLPTETSFPSASASASPSGSLGTCPSGVISNCGNGAGSHNTVIVGSNSTTIVGQQSSTTVNSTVTVNSNTGGNNTGSNIETHVQTGNTVLTVDVTNTTNSNNTTVTH